MRVSEHFNLGRTQAQLDFVDVDLATDLRVFVDPRALLLFNTDWGQECVSLLQNFFSAVMECVSRGDRQTGLMLLRHLREPNETHLGLSKGEPRGRALGVESADDVWDALAGSQAARTGLLEGLEDSLLMVPGIGRDIVSDIATNVIREPLVRYTQHMAGYYGIDLEVDVDSGPMWDPVNQRWFSRYVQLPIVSSRKLLLVPKAIVRVPMDYEVDEYYRHHVLTFLQGRELEAASGLVHVLKSGEPRVYKTDLIREYGQGKHAAIQVTLNHPEILDEYRDAKRDNIRPPLSHEALADIEGTPLPDWDGLLREVLSIPKGPTHADGFHKAVEKLLSAVFYPELAYPSVEYRIHEGRKRIDIRWANLGGDGFFAWLASHYPAPNVYAECKNYSGDPTNPELDQLSGRFSPSRGKFGFLICRDINNRELFITRCRDTALDQRGYIIVLEDKDLEHLVQLRNSQRPLMPWLLARFDELI